MEDTITKAIRFNFEQSSIETLSLGEVPEAIASGDYCWIDFDDIAAATAAIPSLGIDAHDAENIDLNGELNQVWQGHTCIHFSLLESKMEGEELTMSPLHVIVGAAFIATVHAEPSPLILRMQETYVQDFHSMAKTGGFLLFEIVDHLIIAYRETLSKLTHNVKTMQQSFLLEIDDEILANVSQLTRYLLDWRNAVVSARETIDELATRRSVFVPATTQPYLDRQTVPLDRLANDAATERTVLSEGLNLYLGVISHRTNRTVRRLTLVSIIFLPLNFLAAVYGMNFQIMPELTWRYGYFAFWVTSLLLATALFFLLRKRRLTS